MHSSLVVVVAVLITLVFASLWWAVIVGQAQASSDRGTLLQAFADRLQDGRVEVGSFFGAALGTAYAYQAAGRLPSGRRVRLTDRGAWIRYAIELPGWTQDVVFDKAALQAELDAWEAGRSASAEGEAGSQADAMRAALRDLFGLLSFNAVHIEKGWLWVQREAFDYAFSQTSLERVFARLETVAPLYASRPVEVRVLGGRAALGWTAGGDDVRCPYCRDALDPGQEALDACASCDTVHHAECLAEAGGCTVLGCAGAPTRRVPE